MRNVFNFSAGPATLPEPVLERAADEMLDWHGCGHSVMEMSHRGKEYMSIHAQAQQDLRDLMNIPEDYRVLFLQGGASLQFSLLPMNLVTVNKKVDIVHTGQWSKKVISAAKDYAAVNIAASAQDKNFTYIPPESSWSLDPDADYVHVCLNETIGGVEMFFTPDTGKAPLIADISSTFLSRPLDVSKYSLLYGGAQKNIGPAGLTIVIASPEMIKRSESSGVPSILSLFEQAEADSMLNTPPSYSIYIAGLVFQWLKKQGGVPTIEQKNIEKSTLLYSYLDKSDYYSNPVQPDNRSRMNIPFTLADKEHDKAFLAGAEKAGLLQLKGHRSVGGMRASIYNAMPLAGVETLVEYMREFERTQA
ncbi:MAG: 3-phosphoserine/phosphohydroxythreonine transaminase [Burkholderiaceae bacterium]